MTLWKWSQVAATNATADSTINWAEGQAPSSVNDSARGMMAAISKYRDDIAGSIVTTGTNTAYILASNEIFDTLAHLHNQQIAFVPHTTSGGVAGTQITLNIDSTGAKPIRLAPGVEIATGTLVQGTPYLVTYNNSDGAFYLRNLGGNPYNVPLGGLLPYTGASPPNSAFVLPFGQAISRTTYVGLFNLYSSIGLTTYGVGDGSSTFNVPDLRGLVPMGWDLMGGGSATGRVTTAGSNLDSTVIGAKGGSQNIQQHNHGVGTISDLGHNHTVTDGPHSHTVVGFTVTGLASGGNNVNTGSGSASTSTNAAGISLANGFANLTGATSIFGAGTSANIPPSIVLPYLLRVL